jgi:hypothetical protein
MPHADRDRSFKGPISMDARLDTRIWTEACRKERAFQWRDKAADELAAARSGNNLQGIRLQREQLLPCSADFLWVTESVASAHAPAAPRPVPTTSPMAELAMGVCDAESSYLRARPAEVAARRARTEQRPSLTPWMMHADATFWRQDALDRWTAAQAANVLQMPPKPEPLPRVEATIAGAHAGAVGAWRRSEVPLSQWEYGARADALVEMKKVSEAATLERSRGQLRSLLKLTGKVSEKCPSPSRARWFER